MLIGNCTFSQLGGTKEFRDSLKYELAIAKTDTGRVLIMVQLANAYFVNYSDSLIQYGTHALELAKRIKFLRGEASALIALGLGFQFQSDFPKSLEYLYRALQIAEQKNYVFEAAGSYSWIGNAYEFLGDYSKLIDFCKKSQNLFETIIKTQGVNEWMVFNLLEIGQGYLELNRLDSAYYYLSQYYHATLHDQYWHPVALYNLGDCLFRQGEHVKSFDFAREGISKSVADDYVTRAEACAVISRFFNTIRQPDSAIYYAMKGLAAADSIAYGAGIYNNTKLLAANYEHKNVQEALRYRKIYDSVNEEMYGAKKYKDLQITLAKEQQRQQQIQEDHIRKEDRLKQYGFIAGLAIMLFIAIILYRNNLQKKKANVLLLHQKEKVESTLQELRSTQAQLIQQEKMASLGEMTAGIAHEIENPLNFVNNFSEVNAELLKEMKAEIDKGNLFEAKSIAETVIQNEEKIIYHGKRADGIVKGMLQHSQLSTAIKEPTDINKLADEYFRLAYHGMRARDKDFNVKMETQFDEQAGMVNIIPQDIGRVLLNLFNNAFYVVSEKKKSNPSGYDPVVSLTTHKLDHKIEISIKDNGPGIPEKIKEKIFQPFYTTKPSGQGTGLGLSLSYDIVKSHGGEIKVESSEGVGSSFSILLPG
jgi:signal transduction histidine kinase